VTERFRLRWTESAVLDLEAILDHIAERDSVAVAAAARVHERIIARIDSLQKLARRGRRIPELKALGVTEYREWIVNPYRVCFRLVGRDVVLLAILDGRRNVEDLLIERALRFEAD